MSGDLFQDHLDMRPGALQFPYTTISSCHGETPSLDLMSNLRPLSALQQLLCHSEGLGLWGGCPELCRTLQPRLGSSAGLSWGEGRGDGKSWGGAGLGWKVPRRGDHQC